ncbi:MAG: fumarate hydratase [Methanobrevibacter sp.]|jgi:fumarate hydratase subunit alpha|nr:fumarate hydratase [Methanobrevibacter sp.]
MSVVKEVEKAVIKAGTSYSDDKFNALKAVYERETDENAKWALELMIKNVEVCKRDKIPLCDDTGVPHVLIELGDKSDKLCTDFFEDIQKGIAIGLKNLPGRPMAVKGEDIERIEQSMGLYKESEAVVPCSFILKKSVGECVKVNILLLGGGSEIRAKTHAVFHKKDYRNIFNNGFNHLKDSLPLLGCTPTIPAIGVGRTHYEANSLMIEAMAYGNLKKQSNLEKEFTERINQLKIGPMGLGGDTTALGTFINIGPQRASGVRILAIRPTCFVEPRVASFEL